MDLVIGIDIGGTKTKIGLVNKEGKCLENTFFRTKEYPEIDTYMDKIVATVDELKSRFNFTKILGCGIGAPNASSKNGTIENASNLERHSTHFGKTK
jgi:glucokinase